MEEIQFEVTEEFIELYKLLKLTGLCENGGMAKFAISEGQVKVNGITETRKAFKVRGGMEIEFEGQKISAKSPSSLLQKPLPTDFSFLLRQTKRMLSSYRHFTGRSLWLENKPDEVLVRELFYAPFVLASAGPEQDPILNYGNQKALDLWEMDWISFVRTPGKHTAEAMEREARDHFLETVRRQGYIDDYRGIRVSSKGRRFEIQQATVWNLIDEAGHYAGQAATFSHWINL